MKLKIVKDSNPIMKKKSLPVSLPLSAEDKKTLDEMINYLKLSQDEDYSKKHNLRPGIGMAAIQIGLLKRMFVVYYETEEGPVQYQLVNPKIIEYSFIPTPRACWTGTARAHPAHGAARRSSSSSSSKSWRST